MAHVIVLDSVNEDIFVCGECKCVFNSINLFLEHKRLKCSNNIQEQNTYSPIVDNTLKQPILDNHSDLTEKNDKCLDYIGCKLCTKKFKKVKGLLTHMKIHTEKSYQCPICGRCFIQNSHLQRHISSHKVWPVGITETTAKSVDVDLLSYSCIYCDQTMSNYSQYRAHLKNHMILKKYKCVQNGCTSFHDSIENLLEHVQLVHKPPTYECHMCYNLFNSLESVAMHQQNHSEFGKLKNELKRYKCPHCDAIFNKPEKLSLHLLTENHKKVCIHCNKTFASDKRLRLHLQIHRKSKPFQCSICNSSFHMKKYLTTHMLKHGNREFQCAVCQVMFKRQDLLQRHMKMHETKKLYQCPYKDTLNCNKEFSRSDKLKLHIRSHSKNSLIISTNSESR